MFCTINMIKIPLLEYPNCLFLCFKDLSENKLSIGSIVWMMEHFLTLEVFNQSIRNYLKERSHKKADADHLWHDLKYVGI